MSMNLEVGPQGVRVIDTAKPASSPLDIFTSLSGTLQSRKLVTIANGVSNQAIAFDSISAAKAIVLVSDGAVSVKLNASATAIPVNTLHIATDSAGGITAATLTNASGSTRTVEVLIFG